MRNYNIDKNKILICGFFFLLFFIFFVSSQFARTSFLANEIWNHPVKLCWGFESSETVFNIVASDNVFDNNLNEKGVEFLFFSSSKKISKLNILDKNIEWIFETGENEFLLGKPELVKNNILFFTSNNRDNYLISIDFESGLINWKKNVSNYKPKIIEHGNFVVFQKDVSSLSLIDIHNGKEKTLELEIKIVDIKKVSESIYLLSENKIFSLNVDLGISEEVFGFPQTNKSLDFFLLNNKTGSMIYLSEENTFSVFRLSIGKKNLLWERKFGGKISNVIFHENNLLLTSFDNFVYFFNVVDGKFISKDRLDGRIEKNISFFDRIVAISSNSSGLVNIFDMSKGRRINSILLSDAQEVDNIILLSEILFISTNKKIYAYSPKCK